MSAQITPADLASRRRQLALEGDGKLLDPILAQEIAPRLVNEVERLERDLARAPVDFARKAADALAKRLGAVTALHHGGCPACRDAEARAYLAKLERVAAGGDVDPAPVPVAAIAANAPRGPARRRR